MSAPEKTDTRARLLTIQFWSGIALAPIAALLLLFGSATAAAVLAIIAVVILGLAVVMRRDDGSVRLDLEETLLDEIDMLRNDVRADITTAARATHKALAERVATLQESLSVMQHQVEVARAAAAAGSRAVVPGPLPPRGPGPVPGVVRRTETVQVTTHHTIVDPYDAAERDGYPHAGRAAAPTGWDDRAHQQVRYVPPPDDAGDPPRAGRPDRGAALVRGGWPDHDGGPARGGRGGSGRDGEADVRGGAGRDGHEAGGARRTGSAGSGDGWSAFGRDGGSGDGPGGPGRNGGSGDGRGGSGRDGGSGDGWSAFGRSDGRSGDGQGGSGRDGGPDDRWGGTPRGSGSARDGGSNRAAHRVDGGPTGRQDQGRGGRRSDPDPDADRDGWSGRSARDGGGDRDGGRSWDRDDGGSGWRDGSGRDERDPRGGRDGALDRIDRDSRGEEQWLSRAVDGRGGREAVAQRSLPSGRNGSDDRSGEPGGALVATRRADAHEDSWTEERLREYLTRRDPDGLGPVRSGVDDLGDDGRWSAMRAGDRWAEVRSDEHGRELRMGERRTERRVDETGTQLRIVDRWSSVREEPAGYLPDSSWHIGLPAAVGDGESPWTSGETRSERIRRERAEQAALPAAHRSWAAEEDDDVAAAYRSLALPAQRESREDRPATTTDRADRRSDPIRDEWRDPRAESHAARPAGTSGYEQRPAGSDGRGRADGYDVRSRLDGAGSYDGWSRSDGAGAWSRSDGHDTRSGAGGLDDRSRSDGRDDLDGRSRSDGHDGRSRADGYDGRPRAARPESRPDRPENRSDLRDDRRAQWSDQRNDRRDDWRDPREQLRDEQADDRWVREPSARAGARPRPLGFDDSDDRWH